MTWFIFVLGFLAMLGGFIMVARAAQLEQWLGEVGYLLGFTNDWLTWQVVGIFFLLFGFLVATGLFSQFFTMFFGSIFFARPPTSL